MKLVISEISSRASSLTEKFKNKSTDDICSKSNLSDFSIAAGKNLSQTGLKENKSNSSNVKHWLTKLFIKDSMICSEVEKLVISSKSEAWITLAAHVSLFSSAI